MDTDGAGCAFERKRVRMRERVRKTEQRCAAQWPGPPLVGKKTSKQSALEKAQKSERKIGAASQTADCAEKGGGGGGEYEIKPGGSKPARRGYSKGSNPKKLERLRHRPDKI